MRKGFYRNIELVINNKTIEEKIKNRKESVSKLDKILKFRTKIHNTAEYFKNPQGNFKEERKEAEYATFSDGKINYALLKDSSRMNLTNQATPNSVQEKLKNELQVLISSLSDKEKADVLVTPNIASMWKYQTYVNYNDIIEKELQEEDLEATVSKKNTLSSETVSLGL